MPSTNSPTITNLVLPKVVDLSNGPLQITFSGTAQDNSGGAGIKRVTIFFDKNLDSVNGFSISMFSLGHFSGVGTLGSGFTFTDSFTDSTPDTANSLITLATSNSPGIYTISEISVIDLEGNLALYSNAQLVALGLNTSFSIVNQHTISAPTQAVETDRYNYVSGNTPVISGTALPGALVKVSGILYQAFGSTNNVVELGSAKADANGKWQLQTATLEDGNYHDVTAKAIDASGNASVASSPISFNVKVHLPEAPLISISRDIHGHVTGTHPQIFGTSEAGSTITVYEGNKVLGTTVVDSGGRWSILPTAFLDGDHTVSAVVTDGDGRNSPSSAPISFSVDSTVPLGFTFTITLVTDKTGGTHDLTGFQVMLQRALDEIGARFSAVLDGQEDIKVSLNLVPPNGNIVASAGGNWVDAINTKGSAVPPMVGPATLNLNVESTAKPDLSFYSLQQYVSLMGHEMLHVMGFSALASQPFSNYIKTIDEKLFFTGPNAMAINGGMVPLANMAHLLDPNDIISAHGATYTSPYISPNNPTAPFSNLDIAILKDIGYTNKFTLASTDGHTFIPGNGLPGNNLVTGTDGVDTLFYSASARNFSLSKFDNNYKVIDNVGNGGTEILSKIEKVQFSDISINLTVQALAASMSTQNVQRMMELYVAFFNRIPDADGLAYWIGQFKAGKTIDQIAENFYNAGVQYSELTHFTLAMSNVDFINLIYRNVLGRIDGADKEGLDYWTTKLVSGAATRGALVSSILDSAHGFKGDSTWGGIANLLDNKIAVSHTFAIDLGVNYLSSEDSISHGMAIAAAVTSTDISHALSLIGISTQDFNLT